MSRLSIKASLIAIFTLIALVSSVFAWLSVSALNTVNTSSENIARNWLPSVKTVKEIQAEVFRLRIAYLNHITSLTPEAIAAADKAVQSQSATVTEAIKRYEPLISSDVERQKLAAIRDGVTAYEKRGADMLVLSRANNNAEAGEVLNEMRALMEPVSKTVDELVEINVQGADDSVRAGDAAFNAALIQTYTAIGVLAILLITATFYALAGVARPIERITDAMRKLAGGNVDDTIPFSGRADEIGAMAGAVEVFRQAAIENNRLTEEAEFQRKSAEEQRVILQKQAEEDARRKLLQATSALAIGLKKLASGDLTYKITETVSEDFEGLRDDFNASVTQLAQTMSAVAETTGNIDNGTREIASGANDLSKRTEQQAAALEETAAALDQITVNVSNSSKRTQEARSVAILANENTTKSVEVVSSAVDAMQRIEQASGQIANIIGVIDEIAFQTNLLALNAGVEAARAGEAGKGFAVVAQEVRELAQRSANAAKEIKGLIQNSSVEVDSGVKLVRDTGVALKAIGDYVSQINQLMDAIATSAREQSTGLAEVNTAVNQMDQTTQQNAAMVEESTAASATLAQEAGRLRSLVGQFKLPGQGSAAPAIADRGYSSTSATRAPAAPVRRAPAVQGNLAVKEEWSEF
ncbi:methyl-accepting chemotaxis protein [Rhizobium sp. 18065]|uniref:HAMP domain-containing methyl-accepting chemotaxis protein n=1 Tax=Rhizobium sp. 18065 TaxID=2681411 RepID=UPI00135C444C|nr:methyl-accepting chemotaxis protein [Rhizobium sp. 18065]